MYIKLHVFQLKGVHEHLPLAVESTFAPHSCVSTLGCRQKVIREYFGTSKLLLMLPLLELEPSKHISGGTGVRIGAVAPLPAFTSSAFLQCGSGR